VAEGTVAIHQPNFFPWLGYFDKIARADTFVLLDDAQFSKQSRINRVQVMVDGQASWLTAPVRRDGKLPISETRFDESRPWRKKALKTIRFSYAKAPHFDEVFPLVERLLGAGDELIGAYNEAAIRALVQRLGLGGTRIVRSSDLGVDAAATDRLVGIVTELGGAAYLSGGGASGYQEDDAFQRAGIELVAQDFEHPAYPQGKAEFVPGLSVIDALMSCGFEGARELLAC
jgi:WbqC-like protein family